MPATYEPIATTTLGSPATTITINSIPATYTDLRIVAFIQFATTANTALVRFNSDSGSNYSYTYLYSGGSNLGTSTGGAASSLQIDHNSGFTTSFWGSWECDIFDYTSSNNKTIVDKVCNDRNGSGVVSRSARVWANSAALSSFSLFRQDGNNFNTGTSVTIWGILKA